MKNRVMDLTNAPMSVKSILINAAKNGEFSHVLKVEENKIYFDADVHLSPFIQEE